MKMLLDIYVSYIDDGRAPVRAVARGFLSRAKGEPLKGGSIDVLYSVG